MRNGGLDVKALIIQSLQLLVVLLCCVHLDLEGIHLPVKVSPSKLLYITKVFQIPPTAECPS